MYPNSYPSTTYTYGDGHNAYLTQIIYPNTGVAHIVNFQYDPNSGSVTQSTDQNNPPNPTGYQYESALGRLKETDYPDGGWTKIYYHDTASPPNIETDRIVDSTHTLTVTQNLDGFGRVTNSDTADSIQGDIFVDTTYNGLGKVNTVSNPHRSGGSPSDGSTSYTYDDIGRVQTVTNQDNKVTHTYYGTAPPGGVSGYCQTVTDEMSRSRQTCTNALGQLVAVTEDPGGAGYVTTYGYDALDNLWSVNQGGQTRSFTYNSFSELTQANNPESGQINYGYDGNGNVTSKQDARGTTNYSYDALNRVLTRIPTDPNTIAGVYAYDGQYYWWNSPVNAVGHLTTTWGIQNGVMVSGSETWQFDNMGRPLTGAQCTPMTCGFSNYQVASTYNLMGDETSYTDSSVTRSATYDVVNRLASASAGAQSLIGNIQYGPVGMTGATLGNGLAESRGYNDRMFLSSLSVGTNGSVYSLGLTYEYNGNVKTASDSVNNLAGTQWTYGYDSLNRLQSAVTGGSVSFTYSPDPWGNLTCTATQGKACTPLGMAFTDAQHPIATNRILGYSYDGAGNLASDGTHTYIYNLENQITCMWGPYGTCGEDGSANYTYDAQGRRVAKWVGNEVSEEYIYDPQGNQTSAHDAVGAVLRYEIYLAGGRHIATLNSNGLFFNHADWLGTERVRTNSSGSPVEWCTDTPYGMNLACTPPPDQSPMHFTGKQRDGESGLDNFGARYYASPQARFMSPDPFTVTPGRVIDPQQLNLYSYVRNNPLKHIDPTGMIIDDAACLADAKHCGKDWQKVESIANQQDKSGNYLHPELHRILSTLQSDSRTFTIENSNLGAGTAGLFTITNFTANGNDFTRATVQLDFKQIKGISGVTGADLVPGFNKYQGLLNAPIDRLAETFGHEGAHGLFSIENPAQAVGIQQLLNQRDAAMQGAHYPYPPDIMQKIAAADQGLIPTEKFAQQEEKIINGELQADQKKQ